MDNINKYFGETFVTVNWNGILVHRYIISNYGRIYDLQAKRFLQYHQDKDGYFMGTIVVPEHGLKGIRVHRVELMSFNPIRDFMNREVNHKDGDKQNIMLYNLEWMTPIENTRHGWDTGLNNNIGVNNGNGKYTDEDLHKICSLLDNGLTPSEIADEFGVFEKYDRMRFQSSISSIKFGKTHKNISKEYNFMKNNDLNKRYSESFAHLVCKFLSDGNEYTYNELARLLSIPDEELKTFKIFVTDIIRDRTYKNVKKLYGKIKIPKSY